MSRADYYTLLGVSRQAGADDLKKAYRRLAVHWHPDRNPGSRLAEERFKAIAEAYAVLSHPAKRRQYDLLGPVEFKNEYSQEDIFQGFEPGDFFKSFGLEDAREALDRIFNRDRNEQPVVSEDPKARINDFFAGFGQKHSPRDRSAPDIALPLILPFREAALGAEKYVAYNSADGAVKIPVTVPPGSINGRKLILKGRGPAQPGGRPGDIVVTLTVTPDPDFQARGFDLLTSLDLSAGDLTAGCRPLVSALTGQTLRLTVPPGTRPGARFKLAGYGLPKPEGGRGDLLVQIKQSIRN